MEFIKKINFIINHLDRYKDFCEIPTTKKIHEKTILTAKELLYNNDIVQPFMTIHGGCGFNTLILDLPSSLLDHNKYILDIKKYIQELDSSGYSLVLSGDSIKLNDGYQLELFSEYEPKKNMNLDNIVEVMTEDVNGLKLKSFFEIRDVYYRKKKKYRFINRLNTMELNGRLNGLIEIKNNIT